MITAVTGYIPLPNHPRSQEKYRELGGQLLDLDIPLVVKELNVEDCWLHKYLTSLGRKVTHSVADDPKKNSLEYHIVQAQKSEWLVEGAINSPNAETLVWIDYGIFHLPGITGEIIQEFLNRAEDEKTIAIPGCWSKDYIYDDQNPCWRFCGGVMVVPRQYVVQFDQSMKREYARWLEETNNLSWEVNTLARVERQVPEAPIWWYKADHNETMFTAYRAGDARIQ